MKILISVAFIVFLFQGSSAQNQTPLISNFILETDVPNNSATLFYDLSDVENDALQVTVQFSTDGGKTFSTLSGANVSGDIGFPVATGSRTALCSNLDFSAPGKYVFRVIADDLQAFDLQALVNQVDSNRLRNDLMFVEGIRHANTGLAHLNETRDSIKNLFESAGLYFENQNFNIGNTSGQNLIGSLAGTETAAQIVIADAHYDSRSNSPGADDNGSGTVGVMEIARLLSRYPSKKSQRYIGFDLEESGLIGSTHYVTSGIAPGEQIDGVFNFEMIGYWSDQPNTQDLPPGFSILFPAAEQVVADNQYRGDFIANVGNTNSQTLELLFSNAAQQYVPDLKVITLDVPGNGSVVPDLRRSDHAPFWDSNRKALMLTDGADFRNECYHTPGDTLEDKLNFTFMSNVVKATLAAMAQLVEVQHADWAAASFDITTAASEPAPCTFKILQTNGLSLQAGNCLSGEVGLEIFDLKGVLIARQTINMINGAAIPLSSTNLPSGVYALKITHSEGIYAQKIMIY